MFDDWCTLTEIQKGNKKTIYELVEKAGGRAAIQKELVDRVRSHYDRLESIADDVKRLGFPNASLILKERLPRTSKARSGEMGELLATEFIEAFTAFRVPIRRLRYKDGREMALRGDDFLGVREDDKSQLYVLKGESKSRIAITKTVIAEARKRLTDDDGRPTPISLLFVADRLLESHGLDKALGVRLRDEVALKAIPSRRTTHGLFTLSGNSPNAALEDDILRADSSRTHVSANLRIKDHKAFIADVYKKAGDLGIK
jgi:hypothetical protein